MDISIGCSSAGCRNNMTDTDAVYCDSCMQSLRGELATAENLVETREEELSNMQTELDQANETITQLREVIKGCGTCSAILVAKNL